MPWILLLAAIGALALVLWVVALTRRPLPWARDGAPRAAQDLELEKERFLRLIKDLDGNTERDDSRDASADAAALRADYLRQVALLNRALARQAETAREDAR